MAELRDPVPPELIRAWLAARARQPVPDGVEERLRRALMRRPSGAFRLHRAAAVLLTGALAVALAFAFVIFHNAVTGPGGTTVPGGTVTSPAPSTSLPCLPRATPAPRAPRTTTYKVTGVDSLIEIVSGPNGDLWFVAGKEVNLSVGEEEVLGRITPSGTTMLYPLPGHPGLSSAGIAIGPDGNIWFTEGGAETIGRLDPATGSIETFAVPVQDAKVRNTQVTDIVSGPDGDLWFDVEQVAGEKVMPDGYVGRVTVQGAVTLFAVPGGGQPAYIQVGADGNLWSRILLPMNAPPVTSNNLTCAFSGIAPSSTVVRVTPTGKVTLMSENSSQFAGYTVGPDGNQWWMTSAGTIRRVTASGQARDYPADTDLGFANDPAHVVVGPLGNIWYTNGVNILRMTPAGQVTAYGTGGSGADWVTVGPGGRLWFLEGASGAGAVIGAFPPPGA